jgi:Uma2 family endonuclease
MQMVNALLVTPSPPKRKPRRLSGDDDTQTQILNGVDELRIRDPLLIRDYICARQGMGIDQHDEVWEGVYVVPPLANNQHQAIVAWLVGLLFNVVNLENRGKVFPGANVSDRRDGWTHNFRAPDIVVVLNGSTAEDCGTHWCGGPDFLVEVRSGKPDMVEEKFPFYSKIGVRELLVIDRDSREVTLYRSTASTMEPVVATMIGGRKWLASELVSLAFRRKMRSGQPETEIIRTDDTDGLWTF